MLKNYFKTAVRSILKKPVYSFINLLGLSVGIGCSLLIFIYIHFELSFDTFHSKAEKTYRINTQFSFGDISRDINQTPSAVLPHLLANYPEIESGTRVVRSFRPVIIDAGDEKFQEEEFFYADSTFFDVFDFKLLSGNPVAALNAPNKVIFSEASAVKYFGKADILNETIRINDQEFIVSGVAENPPTNTHLQFDFIASFVSLDWAVTRTSWDAANYFTYLVINPAADIDDTARKLQDDVEENMGPFTGSSFVAMTLMPLLDIHLKSIISEELHKGDIKYVYTFSFIAILIIIIACVNYMNLATARSVFRAKEVGMRKVLGAYKPQLFFQFIGESAIITFAAIFISLVIAAVSVPAFANISGRPLDLRLFYDPIFYFSLLGTWLTISFLAGSYPAFVLSNYAPGRVLKSSFKDSGSGAVLRKVLVVFQFAVSIFLFIGAMIIFNQLEFMQNKKLGYQKEQLIVVPIDATVRNSFDAFEAGLLQLNQVNNVAMANESLTQVMGGYDLKVEGVHNDDGMLTTAMKVSPNFINTAGIELVAGEGLNDTDWKLAQAEEPVFNILINEAAADLMYQSPEEAIGKKSNMNGRTGVIKGVMKDFHFRSLKEEIQSLVFFIEPRGMSQILINANTNNPFETIAAIQSVWNENYNHRPFNYKFLDQEYDALYHAEEQLKQVYSMFTGLAILIGCLGLFGLVSFSTVQRAKEIGIRKVLGASVQSIILLITGSFMRLVFFGFLVAVPFSYWMMNQWLSDFQYRIDFSWLTVGITLVVQVLIALFVTSWQSIRAALSNPVDSIRNE
ncbi:MAG: FtsX-like permease family protein [Cyclobacteriaceae bacterium]